MRRYPGNHTDSELLTVPRFLKTRPQAPTTHLAYITDDEAELLKEYKPGTPHEGAEGIPNYDTWGIDSSGNVTGGSTAGGGGGWSGDTGGSQRDPDRDRGGGGGSQGGGGQHQNWAQIQADIKAEQKRKAEQKARAIEAQKRVDAERIEREKEEKRKIALGTSNTQKMQRAQKAEKLAAAFRASGINKSQFDRMRAKGTIPPALAAQLGLAEQRGGLWYQAGTNERYIPKDQQLSQADWLGLEEQQFAMDEGVYGGVAGIESEVNKIKRSLAEGDIEEYNKAKESLKALGYDPGVINQMDPWTQDESGKWVENPAYNRSLGYDPTGIYTFRDIEDTARFGKNDPRNLYQSKYLQRGNLWDDPLSGILAPQRQINYGAGSGGGGWGSYGYGGGGGGGGGYYGPQPGYKPEQMAGFYTPQANLQQAMVNVHGTPTVFKKRGGIVSLLGLGS